MKGEHSTWRIRIWNYYKEQQCLVSHTVTLCFISNIKLRSLNSQWQINNIYHNLKIINHLRPHKFAMDINYRYTKFPSYGSYHWFRAGMSYVFQSDFSTIILRFNSKYLKFRKYHFWYRNVHHKPSSGACILKTWIVSPITEHTILHSMVIHKLPVLSTH